MASLAGWGQTLKGDEWGYAIRLVQLPLLDAVFESAPGKYLLALPMLAYKAAFSTIGIDSYLPYRLWIPCAYTNHTEIIRSSPRRFSIDSSPYLP